MAAAVPSAGVANVVPSASAAAAVHTEPHDTEFWAKQLAAGVATAALEPSPIGENVDGAIAAPLAAGGIAAPLAAGAIAAPLAAGAIAAPLAAGEIAAPLAAGVVAALASPPSDGVAAAGPTAGVVTGTSCPAQEHAAVKTRSQDWVIGSGHDQVGLRLSPACARDG